MDETVYKVTDAQVLRSAAGWYIGALYWDEEMTGWYPWDRYSSGYYATEDEANTALETGYTFISRGSQL